MPKQRKKPKRRYTINNRKTKTEYYHEPKESVRAQLNSVKKMLFDLDMDINKNLISKKVRVKTPDIKGMTPDTIDKEKS